MRTTGKAIGSGEHRGYNCLSEHVTGFFNTENTEGTEGTEFSFMLGALYHNRLFTTPGYITRCRTGSDNVMLRELLYG